MQTWKPRSPTNDRSHTGIFRSAHSDSLRPNSSRTPRPQDYAIGHTMEPETFTTQDSHRGRVTPNVMFRPATEEDLSSPPGPPKHMVYTPRSEYRYPTTEPNLGFAGGYRAPASMQSLGPGEGYRTPSYPGPMYRYSPTAFVEAPPVNDVCDTRVNLPQSPKMHETNICMPLPGDTPVPKQKYKPSARAIDLESTDPGESPSATSDSDSPNTFSGYSDSDSPVPNSVTSDSELTKSDSDTCRTSPEITTVLPQDELTSSSDELSGVRVRPAKEAGTAAAADAESKLLTAIGWEGDMPQRPSAARTGVSVIRARMNEKAPRRHMAKAKGLTRALDTELRDLEDEMSSLMRDLIALKNVVPKSKSTYSAEVEKVEFQDPDHEDNFAEPCSLPASDAKTEEQTSHY